MIILIYLKVIFNNILMYPLHTIIPLMLYLTIVLILKILNCKGVFVWLLSLKILN